MGVGGLAALLFVSYKIFLSAGLTWFYLFQLLILFEDERLAWNFPYIFFTNLTLPSFPINLAIKRDPLSVGKCNAEEFQLVGRNNGCLVGGDLNNKRPGQGRSYLKVQIPLLLTWIIINKQTDRPIQTAAREEQYSIMTWLVFKREQTGAERSG